MKLYLFQLLCCSFLSSTCQNTNLLHFISCISPGTPSNVPPEYILHGLYDPCKEAVRSIGVMIYEMLHGEPPYTDYTTFADVISGPPKLDELSEGK